MIEIDTFSVLRRVSCYECLANSRTRGPHGLHAVRPCLGEIMTNLGPTQPPAPTGRVAGLLIAAMRESPVSPLALCVLACAAEKPGASVRHVADRIRVSSAAVSRVLPQLLDAGLLARLDDSDDRRMVCLLPLEPGTRLLKELQVAAVELHPVSLDSGIPSGPDALGDHAWVARHAARMEGAVHQGGRPVDAAGGGAAAGAAGGGAAPRGEHLPAAGHR